MTAIRIEGIMIEELPGRVFAARDAAHLEHWKTTSYATHMGLKAFYDGVVEAVDSLIESYQGMFGRITPKRTVVLPSGDLAAYLQDEADWIEAHRDEIANGSDAIGNLVDALTDMYLKTVYLLTLK